MGKKIDRRLLWGFLIIVILLILNLALNLLTLGPDLYRW